MSQPTPARAYALPTIHLNGTGAQSLFDEYHAVWLAVEKAAETLQNATCNDRDFYPQALVLTIKHALSGKRPSASCKMFRSMSSLGSKEPATTCEPLSPSPPPIQGRHGAHITLPTSHHGTHHCPFNTKRNLSLWLA